MAGRCGRDTAILAIASTLLDATQAGMPERPKGADCKSAGNAFGGSNPSPGTKRVSGSRRSASLAQWAEHFHGKEGVPGSNPGGGSRVLWAGCGV